MAQVMAASGPGLPREKSEAKSETPLLRSQGGSPRAASTAAEEPSHGYWKLPFPLVVLVAIVLLGLCVFLLEEPHSGRLPKNLSPIVMDVIVPIALVLLSGLIVVCLIDGKFLGSRVVPDASLKKVIFAMLLYTACAVFAYYTNSLIPFICNSWFATLSIYFLMFLTFTVNSIRNPLLPRRRSYKDGEDRGDAIPLSAYVFMVAFFFGALGLASFHVFTKTLGFSRLSGQKATASISFLVVAWVGSNKYPGFDRAEWFCYLCASLAAYVFAFTGPALWAEHALLGQSPAFLLLK